MGNILRKIYLLFLFLFFYSYINANIIQQSGQPSASGRIINIQGEPVFPSTVSVKGTSIGTFTNENGEYILMNIPIGNQIISISGLGIKIKNIPIKVTAGKILNMGNIEIENSIILNEVAVVGKTEGRKQQEQAYAIDVVDLKQIYNTAVPFSKILNNISSIRIREDGGVGSDYNFSLNGFSGNQVKFFLDGIPLDNFGSSFNLSNIPVNMAERVEVYKGVLPVSLGADALGGAVNIISRKDANYLDASYSVGSFNTHKLALNGAYTNIQTGFTARANIFYNYSDNNYKVFAPIVDLITGNTLENRWVKRFHDNYKSGGIKFETGITNKNYADYLLFGLIYSKNNKDIQTGATMDAVYGGIETQSESLIPSVRYKKDHLFLDGLSVSLYGSYNIVNSFNQDTLARRYNWLGEWIPNPTIGEKKCPTDSEIKNREWLTTTNLNYVINDYQSITFNNVFSSIKRKIYDKLDPENESNKIPQRLTKNVMGLGWQLKYNRLDINVFGKMFTSKSSTYKLLDQFTEKERLEKIEENNSYFGYGISAAYFVLPKLQIKSSYEKAYRLPESTEMFGDGLVQQRNPNLKPESSDNINLGAMYELNLKEHTLLFESNLIYRNTKDFILKGINVTSDPTSGYENLGKVLTKGLEGSVKYRWKNIIHAGMSLTFQDIKDNQKYEKNSDSYVGEGITENIRYNNRLPNIPYFFGNADLGVTFRDIGLKSSELTLDYSLNYMYQYYLSFPGLGAKATKSIIPEQLSHDISLGYTLEKGKYNIMLECTNFTDRKLYDNYRLQKPGRAFNVKLRYFLR